MVAKLWKKLYFSGSLNLKCNRVIVMPIVCSEYYLVKSLVNQNMINVPEVEKIDQPSKIIDAFITSDIDRKYCKNFEKMYKLVLKKYCNNCTNTAKENQLYYTCDCECTDCTCRKTLIEKSVELLQEYKGVPHGVYCAHIEELDTYKLHIYLVDYYCSWVDKCLGDGADPRTFKKIKTF